MEYGDLFKDITKKNVINLFQIEEIIQKPKYKSYVNNLVSKRGNVFKNKNIDINKKFDELLNGY